MAWTDAVAYDRAALRQGKLAMLEQAVALRMAQADGKAWKAWVERLTGK